MSVYCGGDRSLQAEQMGTNRLDEDALLDLIRTLPAKRSKYEIAAEKEVSAKQSVFTPVM